MDPLSVMASVVGILAAAGQVVSALSKVKSSINDSPRSMDHIISEVKAVEISLSAIQKFLLGLSSAPRRRVTMIQVDHLLATLTEAVLTFSELEALVKPIAAGPESSMMDRVKWSWKEDQVTAIMLRLERHKSSLSLMLNIAQCESDLDAEKSRDTLQNLITELLQSNEDISRRLRKLEGPHRPDSILTSCCRNGYNLDEIGHPGESTGVVPDELGTPTESDSTLNSFQVAAFHFPFEIDLNTSRVYRRTQPYDCDVSFTSSNVRTHAWSIFSGLSLSEISAVSALALPLYAHDIPNNNWYNFGEFGLKGLVGETQHSSPPSALNILNANPTVLSPIGEELPRQQVHGLVRLASTVNKTTPRIPLYKLLIIGDKDVGKSKLRNMFLHNRYIESYDPTIEDSCRRRAVIDGQACILDLFNTSGIEQFTALQQLWFTHSNGLVLVYSVTNRNSFASAQRFHREIQDKRSEGAGGSGFHDQIEPSTIPIMVVGTNCELNLEREVSTWAGRQLARELGGEFVELSAINLLNAENIFYFLVRMMRRSAEVAERRRREEKINNIDSGRDRWLQSGWLRKWGH